MLTTVGATPGSSEQELTATLAVQGTLDDPEAFGRVVPPGASRVRTDATGRPGPRSAAGGP